MDVTIAPDRNTHWIKLNHQTRMPKRWIAFDTESSARFIGGQEVQSWGIGCAVRWRSDLKTGDHAEQGTFESAKDLWQWVTDFCKPGMRTCVVAHNLGHDARIAAIFDTLPELGWQLEWCNLDRNVSAMTWRSDKGTLVFADLWTWLPVELKQVGYDVGLTKLPMPQKTAKAWQWESYCMRDAMIVYLAVKDLNEYIASNHLGNWQPTGAGMAYATWRHKFMRHKVLVHDDVTVLTAERAAMHTGRAEAWRHGILPGGVWTEIDMRNAYVTVAAECELPTKLKFRPGAINADQYAKLHSRYALLGNCRITTHQECAPHYNGQRTLWPVGTFTTWLWDNEIDIALQSGANVKILDSYAYTRAPILQEWARWVLQDIGLNDSPVSPVVRTWKKHCGRALIGRIALRSPRWELYGGNPDGTTGITRMYDADTKTEHRLMHVGDRTLIESARVEGKDSLPQITGYIMAECRARLWQAMSHAGLDHLAHVDTDSLLVDRVGLKALRDAYGPLWADTWQVKGAWRRLVVYGPRNYRVGARRKASGVPRKAKEVAPNQFVGEMWHGLASDLESGRSGNVTISQGTWNLTAKDPRRRDAPGGLGRTEAYSVGGVSVSRLSDSSSSGSGA